MNEEKNAIVAPEKTFDLELTNSMQVLCESLSMQSLFGGSAPASQTDTLYYNNRNYLISNNRQLLSQLYVEHGIVQTLIDQPVDDAFRAGFEIKTGQLSADEIEDVQIYLDKNHVIHNLKQALKWARLYGGGGILLITPQNPITPFTVESLRDKTPIIFQAVDQWELYIDKLNVEGTMYPNQDDNEFYHYYANRIHKSRVYPIRGKEAPSFIRPRLRGWGMSEVERLVRSINSYLKNTDVVFDLLDEAKVDIFKIEGLNSALMKADGTALITKRIQLANMLKGYNHALTMDKDDEYEQKQIAFTGLNDMLEQIRIGIASDVKMPVTKLFGISSAGFNSGEDDIENYNSMIEGEIRHKVKYTVVDMAKIACQQLFGFAPDDLMVTWNPLRILSAEQEEKVKDAKFNRVMSVFQSGLGGALDAKRAINKDALLPVELPENEEVFTPPVNGDFTVGGEEDNGKQKD